MRDKEIVGLWEAYLQVHQPKEEVEQLDEFLGSGAQKFVDNATKRVQSGLQKLGLPINRTPKGTTTQKQQQAKIKPVGEEVENWVNSLIDEGYDLSEYTWEDMYEMYVNLDEEYDTFDAILEHLIAEGYADTNENALVIMANMSEEWRQSIVEAKVDKYLDNKLKKSNSLGDDEMGRSMRKDIKMSQRRKRASVTPDTHRQRRLAQKLRDNRDANNDEGPLGYAARSEEK